MDKVILLKTQLYEAAKFAKLDDFRYKRLAVILLDNFVEIQLNSIIKQKFRWDGALIFQEKIYKHKHRQKILNYYDELLKACVNENIIDEKERFNLSFCHDVRNNLYHRIDEEELLVSVSIQILHDIIRSKQPDWNSAGDFTTYRQGIVDPFARKSKKIFFLDLNSDQEWKYFLDKFFNIIDKRKPTASKYLGDNIISKIKFTRKNIAFIKKEFHIYFPYAEDWDFNDFLLHYSFLNLKHEQIEELNELESNQDRQDKYEAIYTEYEANWRYKQIVRLKEIEEKAIAITKLSTYDCLERYVSLRKEVNMIFEAFYRAAQELNSAIQFASDIARGK